MHRADRQLMETFSVSCFYRGGSGSYTFDSQTGKFPTLSKVMFPSHLSFGTSEKLIMFVSGLLSKVSRVDVTLILSLTLLSSCLVEIVFQDQFSYGLIISLISPVSVSSC